MEFPIFPSGPPYSAGEPANERVIFDQCGEFVAVMTHRLTHSNALLPCWEVDIHGNPVNTPGVPGSNPNPPVVVNPLAPTTPGVPLAWLGLPNNAPYPDPNNW